MGWWFRLLQVEVVELPGVFSLPPDRMSLRVAVVVEPCPASPAGMLDSRDYCGRVACEADW
jgi:hypothetical protein